MCIRDRAIGERVSKAMNVKYAFQQLDELPAGFAVPEDYHGHLLDDSTQNHWKQRLIEAGEFMLATPFIYSRKREG